MPPSSHRYVCRQREADKPVSIAAQLSAQPLFNILSTTEIEQLAATARNIRVKKGEVLFHKGDPCHGFYVIVSGKIKLLFNSPGGTEKVVEILTAGQTFGESVMFMEQPYPLDAQALNESRLIYVTRGAVLQALESNPVLARKLINNLSTSLYQFFKNQEFTGNRASKQRFADYILRQIDPGDADEMFPVVILPASKGTIASHLGITPEHFSRILHELAESELIAVRGKRIAILDMTLIQELRDGGDEKCFMPLVRKSISVSHEMLARY